MKSIKPISSILFSLVLLQSGAAGAISVGQIDTFEDGTLQDWRMGIPSVTDSKMNIVDDGPAGTGNNFLQVDADGAGEGGRLTFFNRVQWTGDYTAAGVTAIAMDLNNLSTSEALNMRLAINGGFRDPISNLFIGGVFATTASISLDIGSGWKRVVFSLQPGDLTSVTGGLGGNTTGNNVQATLANVTELRLLNSAIPDWNGLPVVGTLGIDNIQAVPLPPAMALFASGLAVLLTIQRKQIISNIIAS